MGSSLGFGRPASSAIPRDPSFGPRDPNFGRPRARYISGFEPAAYEAVADIAQVSLQGRSLTRLIEGEIIPRLMSAHPLHPALHLVPAADPPPAITADEIAGFAPLALEIDADRLLAHVEGILARGVPVETVLVELLAPAARLLGEHWVEDRCDFIDVTMGLWRLQEVVHELATRVPAARRGGSAARRALFSPAPGEQHGFGAIVIEEVFAREGWMTDRMGEVRVSDLLDKVAGDWFDLIGLTVSCDCNTAPLSSLIVGLRNVSRNPRLCVLVGGRVFSEDPALADRVGADGTARDARAAVVLADGLVGAIAREAMSLA